MLLTIYFWGFSVISLLFSFFTCIIISPFVDQKTFARTYEVLTGGIMLYIMSPIWSLKIKDKRKDRSWRYLDKNEVKNLDNEVKNLDKNGGKEEGKIKDKQFIIIANHMSFIDSLITVVLPVKKKFMIGKVFTKAPVFGWLTLKSGFVPAEKGNPEVNKHAVDKAIEAMKDGSSFFLYPEGQRELTPYQFEKFKTGAFRIAHKTGIPILPITIKGTDKAMPIGGKVNFADLEIIIDEPFYVENDDYQSYIEKSKNIISSNF